MLLFYYDIQGAYENGNRQKVTSESSSIIPCSESQRLGPMNIVSSSFIETPSPAINKKDAIDGSTAARPVLRRSTRLYNASSKVGLKNKVIIVVILYIYIYYIE